MTDTLTGKTGLVTGGARRVGAAITRRLHAAGANVLVHYRDSDADADKLIGELNALRPKSAQKVKAELLAPIAPRALVSAALEGFGRLDILVNNASSFFPVALGAIEASHWEELMGSNLRAPLFISQQAAPELAKHDGAIAWPEDNQFDPAERSRILATTPLARMGSPQDIAQAVHFLAVAPYVTGQILAVDGGRSVFI